jgi:alkane 1-monooxygenase
MDPRNPTEQAPDLPARVLFRIATWLAVPVQLAVLLFMAWQATRPHATTIEIVGCVLSAGTAGGVVGITVAHELIHQPSSVDRFLGRVLLACISYLHWAIEHVAGHHRRVATRADPATARLGESLPRFLVRSIAGTYRSAWAIEAARLKRFGDRSPLGNRVLRWSVVPVIVAAALGLALGPGASLFFFAQSLVAIVLLEIVNYIEHYGLERRQVAPDVYERVSPLHSWNASHRLTNALLFNLQRHSDHHVWPRRPYFALRHHDQSPQLPLGYAGMALLAMVPPLWRRVMDPRVAAHRARLMATVAEAPATQDEQRI